MFRSKKLLAAARNYACQSCGASGTTIAAHANSHRFGKGLGVKSEDQFTAYVCYNCHDLIDGRSGKLSREEREAMWIDAWIKTVRIWFHDSIVEVR